MEGIYAHLPSIFKLSIYIFVRGIKMSATPITPTLSVTKGFLSNTSDRAAYLLTFWIYNPGNVSDYFEGYNGSLRQLAYANQNDPDSLAGAAKVQLETIFRRNFPNVLISVDVSVKNIDGYKYALQIEITSAPMNTNDYKPIILSRSLTIDEDYRITLKPY